jgi:protocatechuate 3,4-dioxygenase beta subunit
VRFDEAGKAWLTVGRPFRLRGVVVDEATGAPVADAWILGGRRGARYTSVDGGFDVGPFPEDPSRVAQADRWYGVRFSARGHADARLDPYAVPRSQRDRATVVLPRGLSLGGTLVDRDGRPIPAAYVEVDGPDALDGGSARTDEAGRWTVENLLPGRYSMYARVFRQDAAARHEIDLSRDTLDVRLFARPIRLPAVVRTASVLGLVLADADDDLRAAFGLPEHANVVVTSPGPYERDPSGYPPGLERGDALRLVGKTKVASVRQVVERILAGDRDVTTFSTRGDTTHGVAVLRGSDDDLARLRGLLETLPR